MDNSTLRYPHIHVRIGHLIYSTPKKTKMNGEEGWNDSFHLDITLHQHMFNTVQVDLFDSRTLYPNMHLGRAEFRLYKLADPKRPLTAWYQLRPRQYCYANLTDLNVRDEAVMGHVVGAVQLEMRYKVRETLAVENSPELSSISTSSIVLLNNQLRSVTSLFSEDASVTPSALPDQAIYSSELSNGHKGHLDTSGSKEGRDGDQGTHMASMDGKGTKEVEEEDNQRDKIVLKPSAIQENDHESVPIEGGLPMREMEIVGKMAELDMAKNDEEELQEVKAELEASLEVSSLLKRVAGWVLNEGDQEQVKRLIDAFGAFGQGIEVGRLAMFKAFLIMQRFYKSLPIPYGNNLILKKQDLEIPRIIFKYTISACGWSGLYFFGKRKDLFSGSVAPDANYRAIIEFLQLDPADMLVCDMEQHKVFRPNFFVAIDRRLSAVILSIRGTMSLRDTLTDLNFEYVPWNGGLAHSGMLASATWFIENIGADLVMFAQEYGLEHIYITGHSLGSATAGFTAILLQEELKKKTWPTLSNGKRINLHCYGFGTPPYLSPDLAIAYAGLIDNYIFDQDIVPRLSYGAVADLQALMVYAAEIAPTSAAFQNIEETELWSKLEACHKAIQAQRSVVNPKLHIPGQIHQIITLRAPNNRKYTVVDTCGPDRFIEVALRPNMVRDHMPDRYEAGLEDAYITYLLHELEERQDVSIYEPTSLQRKILSVISLINSDSTVADDTSSETGSGRIFPSQKSSPFLRAIDGGDEGGNDSGNNGNDQSSGPGQN